ncbi:hypothetical protein [Scandinavium goeteborgense]|uniref:VirB8 protein n=1 Tax=Scandinavium goeteborgense TaxID=1851514 RepID=A0A4R6DSI8_SCAGO|nr:hypothetical protein [Scandinavium goeteborgense]TDN48070.1 VirB8 protein [Scandinavium goeteborgense]
MPIDHKEVDKSNREASKTKNAVLRTDRSILLVVVFIMVAVNIFMVYRAQQAVDDSRNSREVVWIKLLPDGTSVISDFKPENEQPVFLRTVNSGLSNFITSRYQVHAETIKKDYAEAGVFMGDSLFTAFTDIHGFNATGKANTISAEPNKSERVDISNIKTDHYDQIDGDFSGTKKPVIRTTLAWDETNPSKSGDAVPVHKMIRITWSLLSRKEISQKSNEWLRLNPLGIVILSSQQLDN